MALSEALLDMSIVGVSAATVVLVTNPIDVAKTRMQMSAELVHKSAAGRVYAGPLDCLTKTYHSEGIRGLQRGLHIAVVREGSKCFFRIGLYDPLVRYFHRGKSSSAPLEVRLSAAAISAVIAAVVCNPLDLAKSQVQAAGSPLSASHHHRPVGQSMKSLFVDIIRSREGGLAALWQGTGVNVVRSITFTCVCLPANSYLREYIASKSLVQNLLVADIASSTLASFLGILVMNPVDVLRTRIYNQPSGEARLYHSITHAVGRIVETEGVTAFWKGCLSHYLRVGPHTVGVLCLSQLLKRKLKPSPALQQIR